MSTAHKGIEPVLCAAPMPLYPTFGSLQEVLDFAEAKLPILNKNELTSLLFTYHNTLLKQLQVQL